MRLKVCWGGAVNQAGEEGNAMDSPLQISNEVSKVQLTALVDKLRQTVETLPPITELRGNAEAALRLIVFYGQSTEDNAVTIDALFRWLTENLDM